MMFESSTVSPTTESVAYGDVVPMPRLPRLSRRMYSVSEPLMFLVEKVRAEVMDASFTSVSIEAMRAVEVADEVADESASSASAEKRIPVPMPLAAVEDARCFMCRTSAI